DRPPDEATPGPRGRPARPWRSAAGSSAQDPACTCRGGEGLIMESADVGLLRKRAAISISRMRVLVLRPLILTQASVPVGCREELHGHLLRASVLEAIAL